jgi:hypothetical protein
MSGLEDERISGSEAGDGEVDDDAPVPMGTSWQYI